MSQLGNKINKLALTLNAIGNWGTSLNADDLDIYLDKKQLLANICNGLDCARADFEDLCEHFGFTPAEIRDVCADNVEKRTGYKLAAPTAEKFGKLPGMMQAADEAPPRALDGRSLARREEL